MYVSSHNCFVLVTDGQCQFRCTDQNVYDAGRFILADLMSAAADVSNLADANPSKQHVYGGGTNADNIDVGATGALSTSGGSSSATKVASYLFLAAVGVAATIVGL